MLPGDLREHPRALRHARLKALIGVARAYHLDPRRLSDGVWFCVCPGCAERARTLAIRVAPPGGVGFGCPLCGAHGSRVGALQRLAERGAAALAGLDADELAAARRVRVAVDRLRALGVPHEAVESFVALIDRQDMRRAATGRAGDSDADTQRAHGPAYLPGPVRVVDAANDDVCRCPSCEGRDDRGEGDA